MQHFLDSKISSVIRCTLNLVTGFQGNDATGCKMHRALVIGFREEHMYITILMKADRFLSVAEYRLILKLLGIFSLQAHITRFVH